MGPAEDRVPSIPPVDATLRWVVLLMRLLGWLWALALITTTLLNDSATASDTDSGILLLAAVVATLGMLLMLAASRSGFMGASWYVATDGLICIFLLSASWVAGAPDFIAGGYPMSWLFLVAYASNLRITTAVALLMTTIFAVLHLMMDLEMVRVVGSIQFIVVAVVAGWAFDALRQRESLRLAALSEREKAEELLMVERERTARVEERSTLAGRLHDSVLQTLKLIMAKADDSGEVRYLARAQERELRATINRYQSPFADSFRARLLEARAEVEDHYRVEIEQVIRHDAEMTPQFAALVEAAREAMINSARHSGANEIDLFAEVTTDGIRINVRDRGDGFDPRNIDSGGIDHSIVGRVEAAGGTARVRSAPGVGTDIFLFMPRR